MACALAQARGQAMCDGAAAGAAGRLTCWARVREAHAGGWRATRGTRSQARRQAARGGAQCGGGV
eukprot:scaffold145422_cov112-Phaeocystis_antarctica.AAC.1